MNSAYHDSQNKWEAIDLHMEVAELVFAFETAGWATECKSDLDGQQFQELLYKKSKKYSKARKKYLNKYY